MTEPHSEQVQGARQGAVQATAPAEGQERAASGAAYRPRQSSRQRREARDD